MNTAHRTAAIYNVWDGDELLRGSIEQIRSEVDVVIVVYSERSNIGEPYVPNIPTDLVDFMIKYEPEMRISAQKNETAKRQLGLNCANYSGCTHFIFMDCDEYYQTDDFKLGKALVLDNDADFSYCRLKTYYKTPTRQLQNEEQYFVPFICKLYSKTVINEGAFPVLCDPTRTVSTHSKIKEIEFIRMHHYSFVRKNISRKLRNSSSAFAFKSVNMELWNDESNSKEMIYFGNQPTVEVPNYFNINL